MTVVFTAPIGFYKTFPQTLFYCRYSSLLSVLLHKCLAVIVITYVTLYTILDLWFITYEILIVLLITSCILLFGYLQISSIVFGYPTDPEDLTLFFM